MNQGRGYAGGVQFTMIEGSIRVLCWVSAEALDRIDGGNPSRLNATVIFNRNRLRIEQLARQKFKAGEQSPIVLTFDL
jgi:Protein of unknown function (DUF1488)